ncbi:MAG TPA: hypothetical protein VGI06_03760 [Acidimicrobiales bacterium]|jgi:hypothetical protein
MAQPDYVPVTDSDRVRVTERLPTPEGWTPNRVGEVRLEGGQPTGPRFGVAGPDQGYALKLARHLAPELVLAPSESTADVTDGCLGVALKRAAAFGRAPVIDDLRVAFGVWGFLGEAPDDLVAFRRPLFAGAAHHYNDRRLIVALVPEATVRLTPAAVAAQQLSGGWRSLLGALPAA